jgi:ABC-type nitrate/sulfonate/bicarbonate transport system substrate-binding protein
MARSPRPTITRPTPAPGLGRRRFLTGLGAWGAGLALAPSLLRAAGEEPALGRVSYQLSWIKNFQFAGCYIAEERGYYQGYGLGVDLIAGGPTINADPIVASGRALVGQSSPDFMTNAIGKGAALRCIGANYQKTIFAMISMARTPLREPRDLIGRRIGIQTNNLVIWHAFLKLNRIDVATIHTVPVQFDFSPLVSGEVDGFFGYLNDDVVQLQAKGNDIHYFPFSDFGYKMFTATYSVAEASLQDARTRRQLVAFMRGEIRGWQDAIRDPDLAAHLTVDVYGKGNGLDLAGERASCVVTNAVMADATTRAHGLFWMDPAAVADTITTLGAAGVRATPAMFTNEILEEAYEGKTTL